MGDYDDRFVQSGFRSGPTANPLNDRKWPQILGSYIKSSAIFQCPADSSLRPALESVFSADLSLADPDTRLYVRAQRTNLGYNGHYLSPRIGFGESAYYNPISLSSITSPSETFQLIDSVFEVRSGTPSGGGDFVVQPPCRFSTESGQRYNTLDDAEIDDPGAVKGWTGDSGQPDHRTYGGAWPWHSGRMTVGYVDGHVASLRPNQLSSGCQVEPALRGTILSLTDYKWDLR
jgi:prepilin-type processing-associated H-X9-DG protein